MQKLNQKAFWPVVINDLYWDETGGKVFADVECPFKDCAAKIDKIELKPGFFKCEGCERILQVRI